MRDCNGGPCRDWVITLAHDGTITAAGWVAIVLLAVLLVLVVLGVVVVVDRVLW